MKRTPGSGHRTGASSRGCRRVTAALIVVLGACGQAPAASPSLRPAAPSDASLSPTQATSSTGSNPLESPSLTGSFQVDASGRNLAMTCWGSGQPAVFLESGGGALDEFTGSRLVEQLAAKTQVCLYNRAGRPPSDPAPNRAREAEDPAEDFHALVRAAGIRPPYVLFGRSFGGMVVTFYASKYPAEVAGV